MHRILTITVAALVMSVAGCDRSSPAPVTTTGPAPATGTAARIKDDLKSAGSDLKDVGIALKDKAAPAMHEAKEETKSVIHEGAQKIADMTASTQPSTLPAPPSSTSP